MFHLGRIFAEGMCQKMVNVLIIVPHVQMRSAVERRIKQISDPDITIHTIHIYGTANVPEQLDDMDVIVARGMTCAALRRQFPQKHIIEISMSSFDILNAIAESRTYYDISRIAVLIHATSLLKTETLEALIDFPVDIFHISGEEDIKKALEQGQRRGADVFIGGLTVTHQCEELGLQCVHIKVSELSLETAIAEAIGVARSINQERAKTEMIQSVLNNAPDALLSVDTFGQITAINNRAYQLFQIPVTDPVIGKSIDCYSPPIDWKTTVETEQEMERPQAFYGVLHYVRCLPIVVDEHCVGALITVLAAAEIQEAETKIRKELTSKGLTVKYRFEDIIGVSPAIKKCIATAKKYSKVEASVLLVGESGTGKELFAHSIHRTSRRSHQPFVAINCAALPENLLESELFGYVEGAFSGAVKGGRLGLFELAHKGTIFLDEIGELPTALQAKLLRVLQESEVRRIGDDRVHPVDVRVISATNINIKSQIAAKTFRADLYYRLNLLGLHLTPLRQRREDILPMADYFLKKAAIRYGQPAPVISQEAVHLLQDYDWPGNSRELRNFCEKLVVLAESSTIEQEQIRELLAEEAEAIPEKPAIAASGMPLGREELYQIVAQQSIKKEDLAKMFGVSRSTLWRWLKKEEEGRQ